MELRRIFAILLRRWWLVLGVPALVLIVSFALARESPYVVSLRATVLIPGDTEVTGNAERPELMVLDDVPEAITSPAFANAVAAQLQQAAPQYALPTADIQASLSSSRYSRVLTVRATRDDEQQARAIIEAVRVVLPDQINELLVSPGGATATVRVLEPSSVSRDSPETMGVALLVQALVALLIGCGIAALAAALDQRLYSPDDVSSATSLRVIADVRQRRSGWRYRWGHIASREGQIDVAARDSLWPSEAFRAFRATVESVLASPRTEAEGHNPGRGCGHVLLLAGVGTDADGPAQGLGRAMAHAGAATLLLRLAGAAGHVAGEPHGDSAISRWLAGHQDVAPPLPRVGDDCFAVTTPLREPEVDIMRAERWSELLGVARDRFAWTIIAVPDMTVSADALTLARVVDGTILVIAAGRTQASPAFQARASVANAGGQVLGAALTDQAA